MRRTMAYFGALAALAAIPPWLLDSNVGAESFPAAEQTAPARIASLSPSTTELCAALGLLDRVVARSSYCDWPPEVLRVPDVGGLIDPNLERLVSLRPDLVLLPGRSLLLQEALEGSGIRALALPDSRLADVFCALAKLGAATGRLAEARDAAQRIYNELRELAANAGGEFELRIEDCGLEADDRTAVDGVPTSKTPGELRDGGAAPQMDARAAQRPVQTGAMDRPTLARAARRLRVLLVVERAQSPPASVFVAGPGSYLDELLRMAGHLNAMASLGQPWGEVSIEAVVRTDPEAILEFPSSSRPVSVEEAMAAWRAVGPVAAVRAGRVHVLAGQRHTVPGPRVAETLRALIEALSP